VTDEPAHPPILRLDGVSKRFGRVVVADELTLTVARDEMVGVVGPNGAGKTSVFGLISGDLAPDSGRIELDGAEVGRLDTARRCRLGIGRTYQVPRPFEQMTVFENVLVAARSGAGLKGRAASDLAGATLEETGLAASANRPTAQLGLLQRKRLELARALATRPRLLLLDEVAAGLTDPEVDQLISIVSGVRERSSEQGLAIVWVEHVVRALLRTVGRLVCLDAGKLVADGAPHEVMADAKVREVYLGSEIETTLDTAAGGAGSTRVGR
jgi:branched-chain amino acid transport system ATP-binding protein